MKQKLIVLLYIVFLLGHSMGYSQERISTEAYINQYKKIAVDKMKEYKIPASITLAQGILESGSGNSRLAREANNHFGIKCHVGWKGKTFYMDDDEKNECFRKYKNPEQSYHDHSLFLTQRPRYAFLFGLEITDYKAWSHGLSKAGYATNPRYPELLIRIIERYELFKYDTQALKSRKREQAVEAEPVEKESHEFIAVNPSDFEVVAKSDSGRFVHQNNGRKLIFAYENDQISSLAAEFNIFSWQIVKYNEFEKGEQLSVNQIVYLEKKRRKSHTHKEHWLREGESMHAVSQLYGIRLKRLYKINELIPGTQPPAGTRILLK